MKSCPECAEEVRAAARKCRFCDFRFEPLVTVGPEGLGRPDATDSASVTEELDVVADEAAAATEQPAPKPADTPDVAPKVGDAAPRTRRLRLPASRRTRWVLAGALVVVLAVIAAVIAWQTLASRADFAEQANGSETGITRLDASIDAFEGSDASGAADRLRDLAADRDAALTGAIDAAEALGTDERHVALRRALVAERDLTRELDRVADMELAGITSAGLEKLNALEGANNDAAAALGRHVDGWSAPRVDVEPFVSAVSAASFDYKKRAAFIEKRRATLTKQAAANRSQLASIRTYAGSFRGVLDRYAQSREDMQDFTNDVRGGMTYIEAYSTLEQQVSRREQLRSEFAALTAPAKLAAAHGSVLRIVDRAIAATQAASVGIAEYQLDFTGEYAYFEQAPSWQRFQTESDSITRDYDSAVGSWNAALSSAEKSLSKKTTLPPLLGAETL